MTHYYETVMSDEDKRPWKIDNHTPVLVYLIEDAKSESKSERRSGESKSLLSDQDFNRKSRSSKKYNRLNVQRWLYDNKKEPRSLENIPPSHRNDCLSQMFTGIRKYNGHSYEPSYLEAMKTSVKRHLKEKGHSTSLKNRVFNKAEKKVELKKRGLGTLPIRSEHLTSEEESKLYESGASSSNSPRGLLSALCYNVGKLFGLRAEEVRQLQLKDLELKEDSGDKYLQYHDRNTTTRDGNNTKNVRDTVPKIFSSTDVLDNRDPVKLYEQFMNRRPASMMFGDCPFVLAPIPKNRLFGSMDEPWYYSKPMGLYTLGNLIKEAAFKTGLEKRVTTHSMRKTTDTTLSRADVPSQKLMKLTAHGEDNSHNIIQSRCSTTEENETYSTQKHLVNNPL